jgi:predicted dehydrogenase
MSQAVKLALIGAGNRGSGVFGGYALEMPHRARFTAVLEPNTGKRQAFASAHHIDADHCVASAEEFFANPPKDIDGVVIATLEDHRFDLVTRSMEQGWHILVEKPLCTNPEDLIRIYDATKDYPKILIVCHQMRLTPVYRTVKSLIDSGVYGEMVCIQHSENVSWHHMAHSYVRGFFQNDRLTPMLLAKSCHDLDLLVHLTGRKAGRVSSFGSLNYFRKENAPEGAPEYCLDGCPHAESCPYDVQKIYFEGDTDPAYIRQMGVVEDKDHLRELLRKNQFGKCVFRSDNNVVDNQVVQIEFEGGLHASFTMCGHNAFERRMTKISMTNGEIEFTGLDSRIRATRFEPRIEEVLDVHAKGTHGGGDRAIMDNFTSAILSGDQSILITPIRDSLEGHLLVFAAEEARAKGTVVDVRNYEQSLRK